MKALPGFSVMILVLFLGGCIAPQSVAMVEPDAGGWQTWVLSDVEAIRPAPPPDQTATQAELDVVQAQVADRDDSSLEQIAYWDAGPPSYRWIELAFAEARKQPKTPHRIFRQMALVNVAIHDAMIAA